MNSILQMSHDPVNVILTSWTSGLGDALASGSTAYYGLALVLAVTLWVVTS